MTESRGRADEEVLRLSVSPILASGLIGLTTFTGLQASLQMLPWRSLALSLFALTVAAGRSQSDILIPLVVLIALPLVILEVSRRRVFATRTCVVRQTGLFRATQRRLPLTKISSIEVTYPSLGRTFDVGNIRFEAGPESFSVVGIAKPAVMVAHLNDLRRQAAADERATGQSRT